MHTLLWPLLNLPHTTTWTGLVTVYSTWLAGVWGGEPWYYGPLSLQSWSHTHWFPYPWTTSEATGWEVTYNNFDVKQTVTWQKVLDTDLHYAGIQSLVACGVKWLNISGDYEEIWYIPSVYPCAMYMLKSVWSWWLHRVCYLFFQTCLRVCVQHVTWLFLAALCKKLKLLNNCHLPLLPVT